MKHQECTVPGERGFVDGTIDESTGLTQLGERAYDADLGRFISVDPLMDLVDAQTMHGYAYANNNPATFWDGSGLHTCKPPNGSCFDRWGNFIQYNTEPTYGGGSSTTMRFYRQGSMGTPSAQRTRYMDGSTNQTFTRSTLSPGWSVSATPVSYVPAPPPPVKSEEDKALEQAADESQDPSFWERSGDWINDNWDTISNVGAGTGIAACVTLSFGMCLTAGAVVAGGKFVLDLVQNDATGGSMRWSEHGVGLLGIGASGAFSGWLSGAMRYGQTSRGMREYVSLGRVRDEYWSTAFQFERSGAFDAVGTGVNMGFNALSATGGEAIGRTSDWFSRKD